MHHWFLAPTPQRAAQLGAAPMAYTRAWYAARASAQIPMLPQTQFEAPVDNAVLPSGPPPPYANETVGLICDGVENAPASQPSVGRFSVFNEIGRGTFGIVTLARDGGTGSMCALKTVDKSLGNHFHGLDRAMQMESLLMEKVGPHPNVVRKLHTFETDEVWGLALELAGGGEVFDYLIELGEYSEADTASITRQVALALQRCHSAGVCHRDVKPANLLFSSPGREATVKLCDFGISLPLQQESNGILSGERGTPWYMAPEMFGGGEYGKEVDMWGLGVVLYVRIPVPYTTLSMTCSASRP